MGVSKGEWGMSGRKEEHAQQFLLGSGNIRHLFREHRKRVKDVRSAIFATLAAYAACMD